MIEFCTLLKKKGIRSSFKRNSFCGTVRLIIITFYRAINYNYLEDGSICPLNSSLLILMHITFGQLDRTQHQPSSREQKTFVIENVTFFGKRHEEQFGSFY